MITHYHLTTPEPALSMESLLLHYYERKWFHQTKKMRPEKGMCLFKYFLILMRAAKSMSFQIFFDFQVAYAFSIMINSKKQNLDIYPDKLEVGGKNKHLC